MDSPEAVNTNMATDKARILVHDIKNSLSTMYLAIDSLRNAKEDKEDPEIYIDMLEKSAKKIDELLNGWNME